jgi:hypothetical protein
MMHTDTRPASHDPAGCLASVAALLSRASDLTWTHAQADPALTVRFEGLGLDLAAAHAANLLQAAGEVDVDVDVDLTIDADVVDEPLDLIRAAEEILRRCPIEDFPAGTSQLVVAVCDLIGERST